MPRLLVGVVALWSLTDLAGARRPRRAFLQAGPCRSSRTPPPAWRHRAPHRARHRHDLVCKFLRRFLRGLIYAFAPLSTGLTAPDLPYFARRVSHACKKAQHASEGRVARRIDPPPGRRPPRRVQVAQDAPPCLGLRQGQGPHTWRPLHGFFFSRKPGWVERMLAVPSRPHPPIALDAPDASYGPQAQPREGWVARCLRGLFTLAAQAHGRRLLLHRSTRASRARAFRRPEPSDPDPGPQSHSRGSRPEHSSLVARPTLERVDAGVERGNFSPRLRDNCEP